MRSYANGSRFQIHVVSFDNGKISQIRLSWDQGSLLKLIDVIGKTGRNWPIRDGNDQIKLIINSVTAAGKRATGGVTSVPVQQTGEEQIRRSRENSTNVTRDPHASLALFAPRADDQQTLPAVVPPRASAKPAQRDYHDLFVGHDSNSVPEIRPDSPNKHAAYGAVAAKAGAGKNFQVNRLFDNDENAPIAADGRAQVYKANPKKFQHFDIASGNNAGEANSTQQQNENTKKNNHGAPSWSFDDFNTPGKAVPTKSLAVRPQAGQDIRHWGNENDEVPESPIRRPYVDRPRKDAETHFEFQDDSPAPKHSQSNYKEGITIAGDGMGSRKQPLSDREVKQKGITIAGDGMGNRKQPLDDREVKQKGINIAGDGMGGKKGGRSWGFGDESDPEPEQRQYVKGGAFRKDLDPHFAYTDDSPAPKRTANHKENAPSNGQGSPTRERGPLTETTNATSRRHEQPKGIVIGGDGMGGKPGAGRSWGFGDESDGEQDGGVNAKGGNFQRGVAPKRQGNNAQTGGGDFWNY